MFLFLYLYLCHYMCPLHFYDFVHQNGQMPLSLNTILYVLYFCMSWTYLFIVLYFLYVMDLSLLDVLLICIFIFKCVLFVHFCVCFSILTCIFLCVFNLCLLRVYCACFCLHLCPYLCLKMYQLAIVSIHIILSLGVFISAYLCL